MTPIQSNQTKQNCSSFAMAMCIASRICFERFWCCAHYKVSKYPASSSWSQPTSKLPVKSDHLPKQGQQTKYLKPPSALQYRSYSISKHSHIPKDPPTHPNLQWLPLFLLRHMYFSQYLAARSGSGPKHLGSTSTIVSCSWGKKCLIRDWQGVGEESAIQKRINNARNCWTNQQPPKLFWTCFWKNRVAQSPGNSQAASWYSNINQMWKIEMNRFWPC